MIFSGGFGYEDFASYYNTDNVRHVIKEFFYGMEHSMVPHDLKIKLKKMMCRLAPESVRFVDGVEDSVIEQ